MSKNFKDSFYNSLTQFALVPIGLVNAILIARLLGPEEKGIFNFLPLIMSIGVYIIQFGCGAGIVYFVSSKKYNSEDVILSGIVNALGQSLILIALLWFLFKIKTFPILSENINEQIFLFFLSAVPMEATFMAVDRYLTATGNFRMVNRLLIYNQLLFIVAFLTAVFVFKLHLKGAIVAFVVQKVLFQAYITFKALRLFNARWVFDMDFIKDCYRYGIRAWMGNMANQANAKLDGLFIGMYLPASALGIYNVGYRMINYVNSVFTGAHKVFFNKVSQTTSRKEQQELFYRLHRIFLIICLGSIGLILLIGQYLINLMYGADYSDAYNVMVILSIGMLPYFTTRALIQKYMSALGLPLNSSKIELVTGVIGLALYFWLIPAFGMEGGAIATATAFFIGSAYSLLLLSKHQNVSTYKMLVIQKSDITYMHQNIQKMLQKVK